MAVSKYLRLNNNSIARVASCSFKNDNLPYNVSSLPGRYNRDWCYDQGVDGASSALNLSKFWDNCSQKVAVSSSTISYIRGYVSEATYESDAYKQTLASILSACEFIFGSSSNGGWGFIHVDSYIQCFWYQGTLSRINGGVTEYAISFVTNSLSYGAASIPRDHITDCVLCCIDNGNLRHP